MVAFAFLECVLLRKTETQLREGNWHRVAGQRVKNRLHQARLIDVLDEPHVQCCEGVILLCGRLATKDDLFRSREELVEQQESAAKSLGTAHSLCARGYKIIFYA